MEKNIDDEFKARPIAVNTLSMYAVAAFFSCRKCFEKRKKYCKCK